MIKHKKLFLTLSFTVAIVGGYFLLTYAQEINRTELEKRLQQIKESEEFEQKIETEALKQYWLEKRLKSEEMLQELQNGGFSTSNTPLAIETLKDGEKRYKVIVEAVARDYKVDASLMVRIITCESGFNPLAQNTKSTAKGLAQFIDSTWKQTPQGKAGRSRFEPEASIAALAYKLSLKEYSHWNSTKSCWNK